MNKEMENKIKEIQGLYLNLNLQEVAQKMGRPLVIANYVCDKNDVIAERGPDGAFQVATALKNREDWRLFQELNAQADAIITGPAYFARFEKHGEGAQNVLNQFDKGAEFADLGDWRQQHSLKRNPDVIVVSRSLDFNIPTVAVAKDRRIIVITTVTGAQSDKAETLRTQGALVLPAGEAGVEGKEMMQQLAQFNLNVIKMTTGPRVLDILLQGDVLDALFITRVDKELSQDPKDIQTVLLNGKVANLPDFTYKKLGKQEGVVANNGDIIFQEFGVYQKQPLF